MPVRLHEDQAAKQRAYRQRQKALAQLRTAAGITAKVAPTPTPSLKYKQWRKAIGEAYAILEATYEDVDGWMQERSERWHEGDTAGELEADRDQLYAVLDELAGLSRLAPHG